MIILEKEWLKTSNSFKAIIIGKLLGDGSITIQKGRKPRFQFMHTATDYSWSNYCYLQLEEFLPLNSPKYKKIYDPRLKSGYSTTYYVQSKTCEIITYLRKKWYPVKTKEIPFALMKEYFNKQSLAWWYMDDGHFKQDRNIPKKIILSTESFTEYENNWIIEFLKEKYQLQFHLDKQNRIILYDQFQIHYFLYLVNPYLHGSMYRKFKTGFHYNYNLTSRRTTIYLPNTVNIKFPTREINKALYGLDCLISCYKNDIFYKKYLTRINQTSNVKTKGYQIVLDANNLSKLSFLKEVTGLNFSRLVEMCF